MSTENTSGENKPQSSSRALRSLRGLLGSRLALAALLLILVALLSKSWLNLEPSYEVICEEYCHILLEAQELDEQSASDPQWAAFDQEVQSRITPYVAELKELSEQPPSNNGRFEDTLNHFVRRPLHRVGKYDLPRLIEDARAGEPIENDFARLEAELAEVQRALDVIRMGEEPKVKQER